MLENPNCVPRVLNYEGREFTRIRKLPSAASLGGLQFSLLYKGKRERVVKHFTEKAKEKAKAIFKTEN